MRSMITRAATRFMGRRGLAGLALSALLLAGSGGGLGTVSIQAQPALVDCDVADPARSLDDDEWAMLDTINAFRAGQGLGALDTSPTLTRAARWKAEALAREDAPALLHDDSFRSWDQRIIDCGYPAEAEFNENLGETNGDNALLMATWEASPIHREIMLYPNWGYLGIARATSPSGRVMWATVFGTDSR